MSPQRAIGIDLGTTNSVMAIMRGGEPKVILNGHGDPYTPSAISLGKRNELLVGKAAKNRAFDRNTILSIKRFMGLPFELVQDDKKRVWYEVSEGAGHEVRVHFNNRTYSPTEISAMILHQMRQDAQLRLGEKVGRAVITVPAYFNDAQVAATREAGVMAGFTVLRIIREPTAAALAFGLDRGLDGTVDMASVLVYDLGGGTFDISIMMMVQGIFQVMGIEGDRHLGGDDFDYEIMKYLYQRAMQGKNLEADAVARRSLKMKSEDAKKELSNVQSVEINIPAVGGVNIEDEITRSDFHKLIAPWIKRTIDLMHNAMKETNMTPEMIDHILLVGGSTFIPLVQDALNREFGEKKLRKNVDPMQCVAFGAAIQSSLIEEIDCPNEECQDANGQRTKNPVDATECSRCHASLIGRDVITCPVCFVPTDANQPTCHKCKSPLKEAVEVRATATEQINEQFWTCLECEYKKNPKSATQCAVCGKPREEGGLKCLKCGKLNPPGQPVCIHCHESMAGVGEAIPANLGIELQDGRMAVLIPKNTGYPTPRAFSKDFYTAETNQRQLEVIVRQGQSELAAENDYCGVVLLDLPPELPKGTEVSIALGLDSDGTIMVTVQLRRFPNRKATAHILRGGNSQMRRRRDVLVQQAKDVLGEAQDLPEAKPVKEKFSELERQKDLNAEELDAMEQELENVKALMKEREDVLSAVHEANMILNAAKKYLSAEHSAELERYKTRIEQALARGQLVDAQTAANDMRTFLSDRPLIRLLAYMVVIRYNDRFSITLRNKIGAALSALEQARGEAEIERAVGSLVALWNEFNETTEGDVGPVGIAKPTDTRN